MDTHIWPNNIRNLKWPSEGITYSYEQRGYMAPEKIEHWLLKAFGDGNGKYVVSALLLFLRGCGCSTWKAQEVPDFLFIVRCVVVFAAIFFCRLANPLKRIFLWSFLAAWCPLLSVYRYPITKTVLYSLVFRARRKLEKRVIFYAS
jgi:hypothetical protein